ncbi:GNAT family N-acetyltransferase [Inhella sp. 4Y17]|uniref:GNAT family N-acetyltransferase n=1 Tax=Inhella gelatinilytica TaxID=2795030 RepID=A0A931NDG7_9BURK|nr:GNAT family N-acetyltransferase [Inhella gelatinilytica]
MGVRELHESDLEALLGLYAHLHENDPPPDRANAEAVWREALQNPRIRYFGGYEGDLLVSSCTIVLVPNLTRGCRPYALIENVVTRASSRGKGWGTRLLQEALGFAWANNCYKVMLLTGRKDAATLRFYEGAGFSREGKTGFVARRS